MTASLPNVVPNVVPDSGRIKAAVLLVYTVFGALLNCVGSINLLAVQSLGVTRADAALLDAYKDLPIAIVSFLVAALLPRVGLRRGMLIGLAAVAIGCLLMPLVGQFWAIKLMFATIGAAFALVKVAAYSMVGLITADERSHASFTNVLEGVFMLGVLGGYALFGFAADDANAQSLAWLKVFWVLAAAVGASFALLALSPLDERAATAPKASSMTQDFAAMWQLVGRGLVLVFLLSAFLYVLIEQGVGTWLPSFNKDVLHLPTAMSVGLAVIMPASTALGRLLSAVAISRLGWYAVVNLCVLAVAALIALVLPMTTGLQPDPLMSWSRAPLAAYAFPLIGFFLAPIYPAINSAMLSALPKHRHAAMVGLIVIFSALGGSSGSFVTGQLFMHFDGRTAFTLLLIPTALLGAGLLAFRRALPQ